MESKYQVVVMGGGPAGSSAAYTLAGAGVKVCLIDRSIFPRDKLCGGLLTIRSKRAFQRIFKADWTPVIQTVSKGAERGRFLIMAIPRSTSSAE